MSDVILRPDLGTSLPELLERAEREHPGLAGLSVGADSTMPSSGNAVVDFLNRLGVAPCRVWGAPAPEGRDVNGCPIRRKVCGAIYPYNATVTAGATEQLYEMFAKIWYWPLFWADVSHADVSITRLEYTGDPVFENSDGTGALDVSALFGPGDYYGFVPGMPAFDSSVPLEAYLANANVADQDFDGMFIGISIRN